MSVDAGDMKKRIREISPIDVYKRLPRTNCRECGETNCMAFATRVVNREIPVEACPPLLKPEFQGPYGELTMLLAPPVRAVTFGTGNRAVTIGGKFVVYRHEFTYHNPPPIAVDVADTLSSSELEQRVAAITSFSYNYIGRDFRLDAIAIRSTSGDPEAFRSTVEKVVHLTPFPLILASGNPEVVEAGLLAAKERCPLLYAAKRENWKEMAELALRYHAPLVVSAPGDLSQLRTLVRTLTETGVADLVLDPGTSTDNSLASTINNFTAIRRAACRHGDKLFGFPLLATPISAWLGEEISPELSQWKEAYIASMLMTRYADLLIMHSAGSWVLLPQMLWRFNLYTDPRKPVSVEPGVRSIGSPDRSSPVLLTTNYALTYFTVEADIKYGHVDCHLLVVDTGGISVESSVAGRYLTAEKIAEAVRIEKVADLVSHRHLVIPGLAARLSGETEIATGWHVLVGPKDSSGLPEFIQKQWPPKEEG